MGSLVAYLPIAAVAGSGIVALVTLLRGFLTFRAKTRFRTALRERALMHLEAQKLLQQHELSPADLDAARLLIEQIMSEALSKSDAKLLEQGLHQPSKSGEKRYISNLIAA